jgi:hypothetical protein
MKAVDSLMFQRFFVWQNLATWRPKKVLYEGPLGIRARKFEKFTRN